MKQPHAVIFGTNEVVWWDGILEARLYRKVYNFIHNLKKDGKCILTIHYKGKCV